jgi:hypothetical protein
VLALRAEPRAATFQPLGSTSVIRRRTDRERARGQPEQACRAETMPAGTSAGNARARHRYQLEAEPGRGPSPTMPNAA